MFGSNAPFGSSSGGFGQQNTTPAFGSPAPAPGGFGGGFGAPAPAAPFGSPAPAPGGFGGGGGFGAPAPTPGFGGGSTFGTPAPAPSAFGGQGGGFGASANTSSPFGAPAPSPSGGLFGAPAPAPSGGLFGAPAPAPGGFGGNTGGGFGGGFGAAPAPAPTGFGGGGSTFGSPAPAQGGLFGAPAPAPGGFGGQGGGGFGATTASSAFGAPAPAAGGMYGAPAPAPAGGGMYGAPAASGSGGTKMAPFVVTTRQDGSTAINLLSISAMPQYEQKCFEELRFEDYSQGNRGTGNAAGGGATGGGFGGGFGAPAPAPSGGLFGAPAPASGAFGAPAQAPAQGGFGGFGAPAPAPGGYGASSTFGAPAPAAFGSPAPGGYGAPAPAPGGFGGNFGAPSPSTGLFGAPAPAQGGGLFGAPAPAPGGLFGSTQPPAPGGFGSPAPAQGGLFGAAPGGQFGAPAPGGQFGAPAPGGFGGAPAPAPYGAPAPGGFGGFGSPSPAPSGGLFGAPAPAPGGYGAPPPSGGMFGAPAPGGYGGYGAPAPGGYGAPPPSGGMFGAPAPAPGGYGGYYGAQAPAASQPMPAAPAVGSIMPPATDEILTAQLTALENKRREIEKSDNFRGKPSESSSIYGLSLSEQQGLVSLTPVRASYPAYRASPRSSAKIRPRGFASPEKTTTPSLSRLGTGGRPMAAPDSLAASSVTRLVINPSPKPKMRLALDASTPAKESPLQITNQPSFSMEPLSFNRATEQTPETPKANETTPAEESKSQSNGGVSHDYYKQVLSSPDEAAGISTPAKKNVAPTLSKKGYTCTPSIQELQSMLPEDLAAVPGFSVERPGVGMIEWEGAVDVRGVNLDTLVLIDDDPQSASVYTQEEKEGTKPPVGTKLNRPAIITLERMFPPANASSEKFARKVAKSTKKNHAELIKYDASTGEWKFRVLHFSRYALADDDSETESENDQNFESGERGGRSRAVKGIMKEREGSPYQSSVAFVVSSEEDEEDAGLQHRVDDESKLFTDAESAFEHMQLALKDKISGGILKKKEEIADFPEEVEGDSEMKENDRYVPGMEDFQDALSRGGICSSIAQESGVKSSSVDFGSRMGKSFRVGWAPDGSFLCLKPGGILSRRKPVFCHRSKEHAQLLERHHENACKVAIADETCPQFSLPMSTSDKPSLQKALKSYADSNDSLDHKGEEAAVASQAFSLLKCLLDSGEDNDEDKSLGAREEASNEHILEVRRIHAVTLWLVKSCSHEVDEEIKVSNARNDTCAALLAAVTGGDVEKACSVAEGLGFFQLSTMLASRPDARNDVLRQVLNWTDSGATSIIPKELLRIYFLIGGDSKMEEDIYRKKYSPFDWRRRLAMRLVYEASTLHENLSSLIQEYEEKFSSGVAPYPQPQYLSSSSKDEIQCVLYRLLRFGKHEFEISLREIVDPVGHTSFVHDFSLSFHLAAAISAMDCSSPLSAVEEQNLIEGYTAQLITQGNWEWAVYVSLCRLRASEPNAWKAKKAKSLVIQNYREDSSNAEKRRQFLEGAGVPSAWFEEALALRCATDGDSYGYLNHMVQVSTDETCTTLEKVLIPNMLFMNKENLDESLKLLEVFAVDESSLACAVYNFFQLYRSILSLEGATRAEIDASMPTLMESCKSIEQVFVTYKGEEERVQGPALRFAPTVVPISSFLAEGLSQISLFKLQLKALQSGISISSTASQILNLSQPLPHEFKETGLSARENICRWLM